MDVALQCDIKWDVAPSSDQVWRQACSHSGDYLLNIYNCERGTQESKQSFPTLKWRNVVLLYQIQK